MQKQLSQSGHKTHTSFWQFAIYAQCEIMYSAFCCTCIFPATHVYNIWSLYICNCCVTCETWWCVCNISLGPHTLWPSLLRATSCDSYNAICDSSRPHVRTSQTPATPALTHKHMFAIRTSTIYDSIKSHFILTEQLSAWERAASQTTSARLQICVL